MEPCHWNSLGATVPQIHRLSKLHLQLVPCEQVYCREATGVWLKHITYTVNHKSKKPIIYALKLYFKMYKSCVIVPLVLGSTLCTCLMHSQYEVAPLREL